MLERDRVAERLAEEEDSRRVDLGLL